MRKWTIKDIDGNVLHQGNGKTLRGFIEFLIRRGLPLDRADLSRLDLSGLNLKGGSFRYARFDGADLRGVQAQEADMTGASFKPAAAGGRLGKKATRLEGGRFDGACLDEADLTEASANGARLTQASARAAILDRGDFSDISASSLDLRNAQGDEVVFAGARLINADFCDSRWIEPDFSRADLGQQAFGKQKPEDLARLLAHLPDRTRGAVVVGGTYDDETVMPDTVYAMRADARASRMTRAALWCTTTLGFVVAGNYVDPLVGPVLDLAAATLGSMSPEASSALGGLGQLGNSAAGLLGVVGAVTLAKELCGDWLKDTVGDALSGVAGRVREFLAQVEQNGGRKLEIVAAVARGATVEPLRLALSAKAPEAEKRGFWSQIAAFSGNLGQMILCDRRHLALALATLSAHAARGLPLAHDTTVIRCDHASPTSPCAMRFAMDGSATAVWRVPGGLAAAVYGRDGVPMRFLGADGKEASRMATDLPEEAEGRLSAALAMEAAALADNRLSGFSYPRETHYVSAGRDQSVVIRRRSDKRLDNPEANQPAILRRDGGGVRIRNGAVQGEVPPPSP